MGDRVNVRFMRDGQHSVWLYNQNAGMAVVEAAYEYAEELGKRMGDPKGVSTPLYRLEPDIVMVDFIRFMRPAMAPNASDMVESGWRLRADPIDADENGNWTIPLRKPDEPKYGKRRIRRDD